MDIVLIKIVQVVAAFSLLIALHEGGHFLFAKLFKIRVEKFYMFFDFPVAVMSPQFALLSYRKKRLSLFRYVKYSPIDKNATDKKDEEVKMKADAFSVLEWNEGKLSVCRWTRNIHVELEEDMKQPTYATEYGIGWLPLGGYVNISGMIDESKQKLSSEVKPWEFRTKPAWQRLLVMLGGVLVNFITALVIYVCVMFTWGESYVKPTDMTYGLKFNEAAKADGFVDGDIIIKTDDKEVKAWNANVLRDIANAESVTVLREGKQVTFALPSDLNMLDMMQSNPPYVDARVPLCVDSVAPKTPAAEIGLKKGDNITMLNNIPVADFNDFTYQIGLLQEPLNENSTAADSLRQRSISLVVNSTDTVNVLLTKQFQLGFFHSPLNYKVTKVEYNIVESIPAGLAYGWDKIVSYVNDLKYVVTPKGAQSVSGVIGITNIFPDVWDWQKFWLLTALLSIALGVMNLLPIPALDGGHVVFTLYEIITRRKPSDKVLEKAQIIGFILIGLLLVLATWNDITRLLGV